MPKGNNSKLKLSYLAKIMLEQTDEEHGLTLPQIIEELERYDVTAERKSIYADFADMRDKLGIDIIQQKVGRETYYYVGARDFEVAEIKLLIDAIQSSKFITEKKSNELIKKIKGLVSKHQAAQLQRQVYVHGRIKTMNESIYYNVDTLHAAIAKNSKIKFRYCGWYTNKKLVPLHNGDFFVVSPWALTWDDEYYYLVAYDQLSESIKHYRVDKMVQISVLEEKRDGKTFFDSFDMAVYSKVNFGMYHGKVKKVHISFPNYMVGVFIDRFGKDIAIHPAEGENRSRIAVDIAVSKQFFGWIASLGRWVKIEGPEDVVAEMKEFAEKLAAVYQE
ncbi:MAG: WYL domain-containing protein [Lachnospiraceae bacterium]|nr:WYL domain-containing protein [Lachnospiraceae bacterium]